MTDALPWAIGIIAALVGGMLTYIIAKLGGMDEKLTALMVGRAETDKDVDALKHRVERLEQHFDPGTIATAGGQHT